MRTTTGDTDHQRRDRMPRLGDGRIVAATRFAGAPLSIVDWRRRRRRAMLAWAPTTDLWRAASEREGTLCSRGPLQQR